MSVSGLPFDDFRALLRDLPRPDARALVAARKRDAQLTKPPGALGRLEEIAFWLAAWTGRAPAVSRPLVPIFAANYGVVRHGITPLPSSVTQQMVENFAAGGAAINQICLCRKCLQPGIELISRRFSIFGRRHVGCRTVHEELRTRVLPAAGFSKKKASAEAIVLPVLHFKKSQ
ncbi:hypothetical protein GCM10007919_14830 [Rhizobium indigoferae]|nr:hypothetical protein GCM10007919_14830 [Rhizobium indigoferae]